MDGFVRKARRLYGFFVLLNVRRLRRALYIVKGYADYSARRRIVSDKVDINLRSFQEQGYFRFQLADDLKKKIVSVCEEHFARVDVNALAPINGTAFFKDTLDEHAYDPTGPFVQFAINEGVLSVVADYLGLAPVINSIELIYSVPDGVEPDRRTKSHLFHRDHIDRSNVKLFVYVWDVDEDRGPVTFIPLPSSRKVPWWAQIRGHIPDDIISKYVRDDEVVQFKGLAGSAVMVDTDRLLHCGSRCRKPRLALIVNYSSGFNYNGRHGRPQWKPGMTKDLELTPIQRLALEQDL